ncbi:MAG: sigma-70 family RNA polymerase sigma factor [Bryobacterales bacterium]
MGDFGKQADAAWETEELFAGNRDGLMRYLRRHLDDVSVAEDIAQESFIRFFQARSQGEEIDQPRAWLYRVAHNLLVDYSRKKRPDLLDEDGWLRLEGAASASSHGIEARAAVATLPWYKLTNGEIQCLRLRSEGLKFREIGEVLGLSISTVTSYIARAIAKLQATDSGDRGAPEPGRTTASR